MTRDIWTRLKVKVTMIDPIRYSCECSDTRRKRETDKNSNVIANGELNARALARVHWIRIKSNKFSNDSTTTHWLYLSEWPENVCAHLPFFSRIFRYVSGNFFFCESKKCGISIHFNFMETKSVIKICYCCFFRLSFFLLGDESETISLIDKLMIIHHSSFFLWISHCNKVVLHQSSVMF